MAGNVHLLKQRVDTLLSSLTKGAFTESDKSELSRSLEELDSLVVDREVLQVTRLGSALTKLSKSLEDVCPKSSNRVTGIIEKWKNQLRSRSDANPTKKQKLYDGSPGLNDSQLSSRSAGSDPAGSPTSAAEMNRLNFELSSSSPDLSKVGQNYTNSMHANSTDGSAAGRLNRNSSLGSLTGSSTDDDELDLPVYSGAVHNDAFRDKALRHLYRCFLLGQDFGPELGKLNELVYEIEKSLYEHHVVEKGSQKAYNLQLKCIAFNLKDIKNTPFNYKIYNNIIPVGELATMSSLQMASDEKKLERNEILEQSLEACQSDWAIKNIFMTKKSSGQFKCGKCNSRQTTYYQLQTRSSDEPMTTFVTCLNCKNRWRF